MAAWRMRPRFELVVPCTAAQALERIEAELRDPACPCAGIVLGRNVRLCVPAAQRHTWSPELHVEVEEQGPRARLHGLFGPHPSIWTFFAAAYAMLGFIAAGALVFGLSQWSLGMAPSALWALPVVGLLGGGIYAVARAGRHLGREQMTLLRGFLDAVLDAETHPAQVLKKASGPQGAPEAG